VPDAEAGEGSHHPDFHQQGDQVLFHVG
jgi:hypothetical protein